MYEYRNSYPIADGYDHRRFAAQTTVERRNCLEQNRGVRLIGVDKVNEFLPQLNFAGS